MEPKLAHVKLSDIFTSETNKMFRDESELTPDALKELIDSVKLHGVFQPVLLRPKDKKFELVAGERRYRASVAAGLATIPANIQELTDEQAFEVQVTENLQRKDVHPLREAHAYKYLLDKEPKQQITVAELALRFGKSEHYIATRLKLNDLIPEAKKDFQENLMTIGHALLIARLQPADQKEVVKNQVNDYKNGKDRIRYYPPIHDLEEYINDEVICELSKVAFDLADDKLVPKAGACLTCPKRSGANQLFADVKEKDRCFDRACFREKRKQFLITQIPTLLEKEPDLAFLESNSYNAAKVDPAVEKVLKENKVKILKGGKDFDTYNYGKRAKIKGIYINGDEFGKRVTVFSTKETSAADVQGKTTPEQVDVKEAIARINERLERAIDLDKEKVHARILEALKQHPSQLEPDDLKYYTKAEDAMLNFILFERLGYDLEEEDLKKIGLPDENDFDVDDYHQALYHALCNLDTAGRMFLMRRYMTRYLFGPMPNTPAAYIIRKVAESYKDIPIDQFDADQEAIRTKREASAAKRIQALKPAKKEKVKKAKKQKEVEV
jgi:ParB/RepB/Spo0J family partition protein